MRKNKHTWAGGSKDITAVYDTVWPMGRNFPPSNSKIRVCTTSVSELSFSNIAMGSGAKFGLRSCGGEPQRADVGPGFGLSVPRCDRAWGQLWWRLDVHNS